MYLQPSNPVSPLQTLERLVQVYHLNINMIYVVNLAHPPPQKQVKQVQALTSLLQREVADTGLHVPPYFPKVSI